MPILIPRILPAHGWSPEAGHRRARTAAQTPGACRPSIGGWIRQPPVPVRRRFGEGLGGAGGFAGELGQSEGPTDGFGVRHPGNPGPWARFTACRRDTPVASQRRGYSASSHPGGIWLDSSGQSRGRAGGSSVQASGRSCANPSPSSEGGTHGARGGGRRRPHRSRPWIVSAGTSGRGTGGGRQGGAWIRRAARRRMSSFRSTRTAVLVISWRHRGHLSTSVFQTRHTRSAHGMRLRRRPEAGGSCSFIATSGSGSWRRFPLQLAR